MTYRIFAPLKQCNIFEPLIFYIRGQISVQVSYYDQLNHLTPSTTSIDIGSSSK